MDAAGIRFTTIDPLAEKYYSWSPYAYVGNNPINVTDPTGMDWYRNADGTVVMWQRENVGDTYTYTMEGENGSTTIELSRIGTTYPEKTVDGSYTIWNQNTVIGTISSDMAASTPSPVMDYLSSLFFGEGNHKPVAFTGTWEFDAEAIVAGKVGLGAGVILQGPERFSFFGTADTGIGGGGFGWFFGPNYTTYYYTGNVNNFSRKSLNGLTANINVSLDGIYGAFSVNVGVNFAQDKHKNWIIGITGGAGFGWSQFKANGYYIPSWTHTWSLFEF